ncbi:MAG TPA: CcmD family protein [Chitinophagaceae bacterium]|jgi:CcmD family protein
MTLFRKVSLLGLFLFLAVKNFAQAAANDTDQSNFMTSNGKIFVVMAVVVVIVLGLFLYLVNLDRKIGKLEKKNNP